MNYKLSMPAMLICTICIGQFQYPPTKTVDSTDTYWGVTIPDPYRWLESMNDPSVEQWFKNQGNYTNSILDSITGQELIIQELDALNTYKTVSYRNISKAGGRYFYYKNTPEGAYPKLYYQDIATGNEVALFDPQAFGKGKPVQVSYTCSNDGTRLLLGIALEGSEIEEYRILDVASGELMPDVLPHSKGASFANATSTEIIYFQLRSDDVHDPLIGLNPKTLLHTLGTAVDTDQIILSDSKYPDLLNSEGWVGLKIFENCPYIFAERTTSSNYKELFYAPKSELKSAHINWKSFCTVSDEIWSFWVDNTDIYYLTSKNNDYFSLKKTSLTAPDLTNADDIYNGTEDWKISFYYDQPEVYKAKDFLVINLSKHDVVSKNMVYHFKTGQLEKLQIPLEGNITVIPFSEYDNECRATNYGWSMPNTYYRYNVETKAFSKGPFHSERDVSFLKNLVVEEVEVPSYDGELVPLSIVYDRTQLKKDGSNTALIYGYGSYGTSLSANFDSSLMPLLNRGVVYAIAHVRGGGEKGNQWHMAGQKTNKPNTWKDFNACAAYLIKNNYTSIEKLACLGASAGGILIGRAITERPDLYKVAFAKVGMMNPLRSAVKPNGEGDFPEYGTVTNAIEFKALLEMDALVHVKNGVSYPAMLITTGYNDFNVPSFIPGKFAAAMQAANSPITPTLLSVDFSGGHFGNSIKENYYKQTAREYAFLLWQTGHEDFKLKR